MNTTQKTEVTCRKMNGCEVRIAKGLKCFCDPTLTSTPSPRSGFETEAEAQAARLPGQSIVAVRSGLGHGPKRWIIRGRAA